MALDTSELELSITGLEKFQKESPKTWAHILHNWDVLKRLLALVPDAFDSTALEAAIADLQAQFDALVIPEAFDPSAILAALADLQAQINAIVIPPFPPPFVMPDGTEGQILTHGPGGNGDFFFASPEEAGIVFAPAQTGDLIPVNEGTADEAVLPEFVLDDDGKIMMIPVS